MYSLPLLSKTFLECTTSLPATNQMYLNTFSNLLYDKKLLVTVSRAPQESMLSQRDVNLFSAIILLAIGAAAARAERTPLRTVWRTDSNRFVLTELNFQVHLFDEGLRDVFNAGKLLGQFRDNLSRLKRVKVTLDGLTHKCNDMDCFRFSDLTIFGLFGAGLGVFTLMGCVRL